MGTAADENPWAHDSFTDKFMYKYLSAFLASAHPPSAAVNASAYYDEREPANRVDFDYTNSYERSAATANGDGLESPVATVATPATPVGERSHWAPENATLWLFDWLLESLIRSNRSGDYERGDGSPLPHTVAIILAGTLLSILTTSGNLMVIVSFKLERQLQTISNYFLFSLAVADLTIGLISIPLMTFYTAEGNWTLGYTTCQFWLSIDYLMCNASVMNLLLISFDRYFSVTRPLTYRPRRTSKKAMIMIASTFLISLVLWPPLIIAWPYIEGEFTVPDDECVVQFLRTSSLVTVCTATVAFYGPVLIMIVLYSRVYYVTRTRQRELVKLQAFHQKSVRRSDEKLAGHGGRRVSHRRHSGRAGGSQHSKKSAVGGDPAAASSLDEHERAATRRSDHSVPSCGGGGDERLAAAATLRKIETEAKPWGIQALLDHFSRSKYLHGTSSRKGSLASSGFEEDESFSLASGDNTTSEGHPLRTAGQKTTRTPASPTPSDYGSTLTNQFVNHVRQSFMRKKTSGGTGRHASLMPRKSRSAKRRRAAAAADQPAAVDRHHQRITDPANSPIQELRKLSTAVVKLGAPSSVAAAPGTSADEQAYTILIELGNDHSQQPVVETKTTEPRLGSRRHPSYRRSWMGGRPAITLRERDRGAHLSPGGPGRETNARATVRRLSSCGSAISESTCTAGRPVSPLIIANRGVRAPANERPTGQPAAVAATTSLAVNKGGGLVSRLSSMRALAGLADRTSGSSGKDSERRRRRGERRQQESKAARTLSAILLAFIVTWTPYNLIVCVESFYPNYVSEFWFTFSYYLCYLNSTVNPLLYALCNATFRRTFWRIMTLKWTPVKPAHRPSSHHHAAAAIAAVAVAAANRRTDAAVPAAPHL